MNKVNFDSLNNIKAPEQWLKNAAAIPEASAKKCAFPLYRIAAAASIVLVSAIGLLTYLFFGNPAPIVLRDRVADKVPPTESTEEGTFPDDGSVPRFDTILPTIPPVYPTDADGVPVIEPVTETIAAKERKQSSAADATEKASEPSPTEKGRSRSKPVSATEIAAEPTQGEPLPTTDPDSVITPEPTDPPVTTEPPKEPSPTESQGEVPMGELCFTATFPASLIEEGEPIYCKYREIGCDSLEVEADIPIPYTVMKNGMVFAMCEPDILITGDGTTTFEYWFYTDSVVLAQGTLTV